MCTCCFLGQKLSSLSKDGYYGVDCSTYVTYTFCPYQPVVNIAVLGYIVIEGYKGLMKGVDLEIGIGIGIGIGRYQHKSTWYWYRNSKCGIAQH